MMNQNLIEKEFEKNTEAYNLYKEFCTKLEDEFKSIVTFSKNIDNLFPKYFYFDSFNDMIPDEIEYKKLSDEEYLKKNNGFKNILKYLEISVDDFIKLVSGENRDVNRKLKLYSKKFSGYFRNLYKQDVINISLRRDGELIIIDLYDSTNEEIDTKPSQRSKGFQWFFSFLLMLENIKNENAIILIDEPGLYLHASAQEDILKVFEEQIQNIIFYSTHSPFLINVDEMHRVKLVIKESTNGNGTKVINKYYCVSDFETMTPIISAIGYNISKSPIGLGSGLNIICEGVSDRYYLLAFLKLFDINKQVNIIPSIGASKTWLLASICLGWNLKHYILLDNDSAGNSAEKQLKKLYFEDACEYVIRTPIKSGTIESVFSGRDEQYSWQNNSGKNKLLVAKEFYENVKNDRYNLETFTSKTKMNIKQLLNLFGLIDKV